MINREILRYPDQFVAYLRRLETQINSNKATRVAGPGGGGTGAPGVDGATWITSVSDPTSLNGKDGDLWLNTMSYDIFRKVSGSWSNIGNVKGADGGRPNYSLTEQKLSFKWHDNEDVYEKTIVFGALPDTSTKSSAHSILNFGSLVSITVVGEDTSAGVQVDVTSIAAVTVDDSLVYITTSDDQTNVTTVYVTLRYTKG